MSELSQMDLFLHTSIEESFGMAIVEAMAMGIPVIAGVKSGGPEWILKEGGGILTDVTNVDKVKKSLENLLQPVTYKEVSLKAKKIAMSRFSKEVVVNQYLTEYKRMLSLN
jgi:glycosyltransferase involved in cell wall biosynthesis